MSKAFADVAESDSLKVAILWNCESGFSIIRILMAESAKEISELCLKHGASSFVSTPESAKALSSVLSLLGGSEGAELEPMLSHRGLNGFSLKALQFLKRRVPRGRVISYGRLAALCGSPGAARAAGLAMSSNPFPLFYPCHRVVGSTGSLTGFGFGLPMKRKLLQMEGVLLKNDSIRMDEFGI